MTAILAGVSLDRLGMPPIVQPIHLLMANLILGTQFFMWLALRYSVKTITKPHEPQNLTPEFQVQNPA